MIQHPQPWRIAFEKQFPDLIGNAIAEMCFREGWSAAVNGMR